MINKTILTIVSVLILVTASSLAILSNTQEDASAAVAKDFKPGRIIDDAVFYNNGSMNASQIQNFLNSKVPNCDTNGTGRATDWGRGDITRAKFAEGKRNGTIQPRDTGFHAPPYTCLRDFRQDTPQMEPASGLCGGISAKTNRTAAQIIKDVADACGINPQVLIVLLEKEQSLVTDIWPLQRQFRSATGFACPDTAPCNPEFNGFFYQVYYAARQFNVYKSQPNSYNYKAGQTNKVYWQTNLGEFVNPTGNANDPSRNGRSACGHSNIHIENQATAALYIYTPYRPNQAAMNNLYGTGDGCSAYGNRNFWRIFTDWFGPTILNELKGSIGTRYKAINGSKTMGNPTTNEISLTSGGVYQQFEKGRIYWKTKIGAWEVKGSIGSYYVNIKADASPLGYPVGEEKDVTIGVKYQEFEGGRIYWISKSGTFAVYGDMANTYIKHGAEKSRLKLPKNNQLDLPTGGTYQEFEGGRIYSKDGLGAYTLGGSIGSRFYNELKADSSALGYPTSEETTVSSGIKYQQFEKGRIYWKTKVGTYSVYGKIGEYYVSIEADKSRLGLPTSNEIRLSTGGVYQTFEKGRIYWKKNTGAWDLGGSIGSLYYSLGADKSKLGYPIGPEDGKASISITQKFEKGSITYKNKRTTYTIK